MLNVCLYVWQESHHSYFMIILLYGFFWFMIMINAAKQSRATVKCTASIQSSVFFLFVFLYIFASKLPIIFFQKDIVVSWADLAEL